jgi:hypothetical protein
MHEIPYGDFCLWGEGILSPRSGHHSHTSPSLTRTPTETFTDLGRFPALTRKGVEQMKVKSNVKAGSYRARGNKGGFEE